MEPTDAVPKRPMYKAEPKLSNGGLGVLEDSLSAAHALVDEISGKLHRVDERLYVPRTVNLAEVPSNAPTTCVEGNLLQLITRLREVERQVALILG